MVPSAGRKDHATGSSCFGVTAKRRVSDAPRIARAGCTCTCVGATSGAADGSGLTGPGGLADGVPAVSVSEGAGSGSGSVSLMVGRRVTMTSADFVGSSLLVAITSTCRSFLVTGGAVYIPPGDTVPIFGTVDQVTP